MQSIPHLLRLCGYEQQIFPETMSWIILVAQEKSPADFVLTVLKKIADSKWCFFGGAIWTTNKKKQKKTKKKNRLYLTQPLANFALACMWHSNRFLQQVPVGGGTMPVYWLRGCSGPVSGCLPRSRGMFLCVCFCASVCVPICSFHHTQNLYCDVSGTVQ